MVVYLSQGSFHSSRRDLSVPGEGVFFVHNLSRLLPILILRLLSIYPYMSLIIIKNV
jgi:hypothetical protein